MAVDLKENDLKETQRELERVQDRLEFWQRRERNLQRALEALKREARKKKKA